jgi:hypothetical protein
MNWERKGRDEDNTRDCVDEFEFNKRRFLGLNRHTPGVDIRGGSEPAVNTGEKEIKVTCSNCGQNQKTSNRHHWKCDGCRVRNFIRAYDIEAAEWSEEDW